ncbi:NnrS family protein [Pseudomonadota bacterium]
MAPTVKIDDPFDQPPVTTGFALFNYGFRPFFLLAGLMGALGLALWVALFGGYADLGLQVDPALWHGHEMLFGYTTAALAGFFLTVVPNWTRAKAQRGPVLMVLSALWLVGRVAYWGQGSLPYEWVAAADMAFLVVLTALVSGPLLKKQHRRQFVFVPILLCLIAGNAMTHAYVLGIDLWNVDWRWQGLVLGLDAAVLLVVVMGGRVTPSFTSSFLGHQNPNVKVAQRPGHDRWVLASMWGLVVFDQILPGTAWAGGVALIAAVLNGARLAGWQGLKVLNNPILWVLHLGYLWLVVGLALKGLGDFGVLPQAAAWHGLTVGAIGTMTLAIMTRASLGHTGRTIKAHPLIVLAYGLVSAAAVLRLSVLVWPASGAELISASGLAWSATFVLFSVIYAPILVRPRVDGRPG